MGRGILGRMKDAEQKKALLTNKTFKKRLGEAGFEDADLEAMDINTISQALDISNKLDTAIGKQKKKGLEDITTELETKEKKTEVSFLDAAILKLGDEKVDNIMNESTSKEELDNNIDKALLEDSVDKMPVAGAAEKPFKLAERVEKPFKLAERVGEPFKGTTGNIEYSKSEVEIQQDESAAAAAVTAKIVGETGSQEGKEAAAKSRNFRRVDFKMSQAMGLLGKVYKRAREGTGGIVKGGHGLQGIALGAVVTVQQMANINKFYKPYMGHINMAGMAMMRMQFPGRSKELVDLTLTTVPKPTGNPHMDIVQGAESFIDNFNETLATAVNESGEPKYDREEAKQLSTAYRDTIYGQLIQGMVEGEVLTFSELDDDELQQLIKYRSIVNRLKGGE